MPPPTAARAARTSSFRFARPTPIDRDIKRLRRLVSDGMPTVILCDNVGQCERLDEILNEDARRAIAGRAHRGRRRRRLHRVRARAHPSPDSASSPTTRSSGASGASAAIAATARARRSRASPRSSPATTWCISSTASASIAASSRCSCARARSRWPSSSTRAATGSTCRSTASIRWSAIARPTMSAAMSPPPRLHKLGGKRWARSATRRAPRCRR